MALVSTPESMCHQVFETLDLNSSCKFIFIQKGVQLRKVSQWPPWLIKIFRKSIPGIHKRVNCCHQTYANRCLYRSCSVMLISRSLEISQRRMEVLPGTSMALVGSRCSGTLTNSLGAPTMSEPTEQTQVLNM